MTKLEQAARALGLEALDAMLTHMGMDEDEWTKPTFDQARVAITALREALDHSGEATDMVAEQADPVAFRFPRDTESWTGGWTIDYKVIRSVDAEIEDNEFKPCLESVEQVLLALEKVYAAPQPVKQEPVAWMHKDGCVCSAYDKENMFGHEYFNIPLYTNPVRTKDLTDDEILSVPYWGTGNIPTSMVNFARAVIEKFKEKQK